MLTQVLPRRPVEGRASGQVSWLSDHPTPRAFPAQRLSGQWLHAGFVPDYSDGVAADSHRLPWGSHLASRPVANDAVTVADGQSGCKRRTYESRGKRILELGGTVKPDRGVTARPAPAKR